MSKKIYKKLEARNIVAIRYTLFFLLIFTVLNYSLGAYFETYIKFRAQFWTYFTNLSLTISLAYWTIWYCLRIWGARSAEQKWLNNFYIKAGVVFGSSATGIIYMFFLFGPIIYGYFAGYNEGIANFNGWLFSTLFMHLFAPIFLWVEFRISKYKKKKLSKKSFVWILLYPSIYACGVLAYVVMGGVPPYPFFNIYENPILSISSIPLGFVLFYWMAYFIKKRYEENFIKRKDNKIIKINKKEPNKN